MTMKDDGDSLHVSSSILQIPVTLQVQIGSAALPLSELMKLSSGSEVVLDQSLGDAVTILVNGKPVAMGEIFVSDETGALGVTIIDLINSDARGGRQQAD